MTEPITRMYENETRARDVAAELRRQGFSSERINLVGPSAVTAPLSNGAEQGRDEVRAAIEKGGVPKGSVNAYADGVRNGHAVISVAPPFGAGRRATAILESFDPIKSVVSEPAREIADVAEAVRPANDPPVTSDEAMTNFSGDEGPVIEDVAAPFSDWLKLPLLIDSATPFSSWMKLSILSGDATPLSSWLKLPVLMTSAAPMSQRLGWPVLWKHPVSASDRSDNVSDHSIH